MSGSEVARMRAEIELTCQAMYRGFTGYAITSRHDIIRHRYQILTRQINQLTDLIGEQEADEITAQIYNATVKGQKA